MEKRVINMALLVPLLLLLLVPPDWTFVLDPVDSVIETGFTLSIKGQKLFEHTSLNPAIYMGQGKTTFSEHHGNFDIDDYVETRMPANGTVDISPDAFEDEARVTISLDRIQITLRFVQKPRDVVSISFEFDSAGLPLYNRVWLRFPAAADDLVFGGGEQFTYFNLRGHRFPIWTREQGVGRNKSEIMTFYADSLDGGAGGDYHSTYFPQPTFITSTHSFVHISSSAYSVLDFTHSDFHEVEIQNYGLGFSAEVGSAPSFLELATTIGELLGKQAALPSWLSNGTILGVQGGTDMVLGYLNEAKAHNVAVSGLWIQDWTGRITTSFGRRLFWDWVWDSKQYPNLDTEIIRLKNEGTRMFAYITPNLNAKGTLYPEADKKGYLVKNSQGTSYLMDFGEFNCGFIDLTNPEAVDWFKGIIKSNLIDFGFSGWMADFSEYTPVDDAVFYSGERPDIVHNKFPYLWAKVNREAVEEAGKLGEILFWMRAGTTGTQNTSVVMWAGDQNVDFERSDGIPSTIPAALSMTVSGMGLSHFDIGGYTGLFGLNRSREVLLRSAEMAVFTALMRTHEGNRPSENFQVYTDDDTWKAFSRLTRIYTALAPYLQSVMDEHTKNSWGVQRPLFYHYEGDGVSFGESYSYLLGSDLLVAPVLEANRTDWRVTLPGDDWIHLWSGTEIIGPTWMTVSAPLGQPPVFYRRQSPWADSLFFKLKDIV